MTRPSMPSLGRPRAFTVIELLVVISLIVILVLIAVPSFSAMIASSEAAMAETQLRTAMRAARDAAVRSAGGSGSGDGAAVFFFEPGGRLSIVPCVKAGEIDDWADPIAQDDKDTVRREVFVAAPGYTPVVLPKYWAVRGYVPANALSKNWYGVNYSQTTNPGNTGERAWVFPETGFYDDTVMNDGPHRSTFMVRFQGGTGALVGSSTEPVLVLAPRPGNAGRTGAPYSDFRADKDANQDPVGFVRRVLSMPTQGTGVANRRLLLGRVSTDMVMARPVMQIALYNERKLAESAGVRLDSKTGSVYQPYTPGAGPMAYVAGARHPLSIASISSYIEGDTNFDGAVDDATATGTSTDPDRPEAQLYAIDRTTGVLRKMEVQK